MSIPVWKSFMEEEMFVLSQNASWSLVTHPPRKLLLVVVGYYEVLGDGSIEHLKAHLVAKGYS